MLVNCNSISKIIEKILKIPKQICEGKQYASKGRFSNFAQGLSELSQSQDHVLQWLHGPRIILTKRPFRPPCISCIKSHYKKNLNLQFSRLNISLTLNFFFWNRLSMQIFTLFRVWNNCRVFQWALGALSSSRRVVCDCLLLWKLQLPASVQTAELCTDDSLQHHYQVKSLAILACVSQYKFCFKEIF